VCLQIVGGWPTEHPVENQCRWSFQREGPHGPQRHRRTIAGSVRALYREHVAGPRPPKHRQRLAGHLCSDARCRPRPSVGQDRAGSSPAFSASWHCGSPNSTGLSRPSGPAADSRFRPQDNLQNEGAPDIALQMPQGFSGWLCRSPRFDKQPSHRFEDSPRLEGSQW
jgi:hypothetical protein